MLNRDKIHFSLIYSATPNNPQRKYLRQCHPYTTLKYLNRVEACVYNDQNWGGFNLNGNYTLNQEPYDTIVQYKPLIIYEMVINYSDDLMQLSIMKNETFFRKLNGYLVKQCLIQMGFSPYITYALIFHHRNGAHEHIHAIFFEYQRNRIKNRINCYRLQSVHTDIVKQFWRIFNKIKKHYLLNVKDEFRILKLKRNIILTINIVPKYIDCKFYNYLVLNKDIYNKKLVNLKLTKIIKKHQYLSNTKSCVKQLTLKLPNINIRFNIDVIKKIDRNVECNVLNKKVEKSLK